MNVSSNHALALGFLLGFIASTPAFAQVETYPPMKLRAYGTLSGTLTHQRIDGQAASVLKINCDDAGKAKLVLAKYISDLQLLPGTKAGSFMISAMVVRDYEVEAQGTIVAARAGATTYILAAPSSSILARLAAQTLSGDAKEWVFAPEVAVPMYLDRWDRFGFRIGCRPLEAPKGMTFRTYDKQKEFDWAASLGDVGFMFWNWTDQTDTAEGFVADHYWDWGYQTAKDLGLTVEIDLATVFYHGTQLWLSNRYPNEMAQRVPGFVGGPFVPMGLLGNQNWVSWDSGIGLDIQLAELQQTVRRYAKESNIIGWQEPHSEMRHTAADMLQEHGDLADRSFADWLRDRYRTLSAVAQRWRIEGFQSWQDIHVPELASFLGWGPEALDLGGSWRVLYPDVTITKNQPITFPAEMFAADFDDSGWPEVTIPGDDHAIFLPQHKPAVFRRNFQLPEAWSRAHPRVWLYLFDMNESWGQEVQVSLNGQNLGPSSIRPYDDHADWYEVTYALKPGTNKLIVGAPGGYIAYRVYLSGSKPLEYPYLGTGQNARWADYVDWMDSSRVKGIQRGMEMIRQVDPDRDIFLAAPNSEVTGLTSLARRYGGDFHNTGSMSGSWSDYLPSLMAGAGLPFSLEPGNGFQSVDDVRGDLGRWSTEGIQSVDYIQTVEEITLHEDIRKEFESHINDLHLIGKYHVPDAQWATLYSSRVNNLKLFPWGKDPNLLMASGAPLWDWVSEIYPRAGITDAELVAKQANSYRVIIDSNTSIMDPDLIQAIEEYVRQGGIFVTFVQTGRHTSIEHDTWPISRLTGYSVAAIDPLDNKGIARKRGLHLVPGQDVFSPGDWPNARAFSDANGLSLKKIAPECRDLMQWDDGSIAAGIRPLGSGYVVNLGVKFSNNKIWSGNRDATDHLFNDILQWAKLQREPAQLDHLSMSNAPNSPTSDLNQRPGDTIKFRHFISNNGLYDVWAVWNMKPRPVSGSIHFRDIIPTSALAIQTGKPYPIDTREDGSRELNFQLDSGETENFLTPRGRIAAAPEEWFKLQRAWWSGTAVPPASSLPSVESIRKLTLALDGPWAMKSMETNEDPALQASPTVDDSHWNHQVPNLKLSALPNKSDPPRRLLLRRRFTVPPAWAKGEISLWIQSLHRALWEQGRVYCDGQLIRGPGDGVTGDSFNGLFKPGSTHLLAIEIESKSSYLGIAGNVWLSYMPDPLDQLDLAGNWETSADALRFDTKATFPGSWRTWMARRKIRLDPSHEGQSVFLHLEPTGVLDGAIINGRYVAGQPKPGEKYNLNITSLVHFGQDNEIELVGNQNDGTGSRNSLNKVSLTFYSPGMY